MQEGIGLKFPRPSEAEVVIDMNDASHHRIKPVPLGEAVGLVAAEFVTPYPPGTPIVRPGEKITRDIVEFISTIVEMGGDVVMLDPQFQRIYVVVLDG